MPNVLIWKKVLMCILLIVSVTIRTSAQSSRDQWVDSVLNTLDTEEKIGQLFIVPVYLKGDKNYLNEIEDEVKSHSIGGIVVMNGGLIATTRLVNQLQSQAKVPLFIGMDATRGLGNTIDSTLTFPTLLALGAIKNDTLIYQVGKEIARQMKLLGMQINFAPSADYSSIQKFDSTERSFGEDRTNIAGKSLAYMKGLQDNGIMACSQNFPIQGLTFVTIKKDGLPELVAYMDHDEIYPYKQLFDHGIKGVIATSAEFPVFFERKKLIKKNKFSPGLLTSIYAGEWLKKEMNYNGLVFVSIPDIHSKSGEYNGGDAELLSFQAGNDIILFPQDINPAIRKIKRLLKKEPRYEDLLDSRVKRILAAKYDAGLNNVEPVRTHNLYQQLNTREGTFLVQKLRESMVTAVKNEHGIIPLKTLENKKIVTLSIGKFSPNTFTKYTEKYAAVEHLSLTPQNQNDVLERIKEATTVVVALFDDPSKHGSILKHLAEMQISKEIVICVFNSPIYLGYLDAFSNVLQCYSDSEAMLKTVAQQLFGTWTISGTLPLSVSNTFKVNQGQTLESLKRLSYSFPEDAQLDSKVLEKIDVIAKEAIDIKATPGCVVLIARNGKVVYEKSFGHLTYDNFQPATNETIYDLASVTKVTATLQAVMFMYDRGLIDINKKASYYLPELKTSNKKDDTLKDILTHQAGLWPFLPFWAQTKKDTVFLPEFYSRVSSEQYPYVVSEGLYASRSMRDSLWSWIVKAKIRDKIARTPYDYRYSDMGFYILQHLAERVLNQPIEDFLEQNLYEPLGATSLGYLPLNRFAKERIAPTENDLIFRRHLLLGTVHDQGAAMMGGVAGHAGLFGDANDLAKLGQMLLQDGFYGGIQYYKPETVRLFTGKQFNTSRRGLGWDKPIQSDWNSPTSIYASPKTFGHTGFTGTCIWVDPEFNLVYIFLSNRVYPDMTNNKLLNANIRSRIQDVIYQSIFSYCE